MKAAHIVLALTLAGCGAGAAARPGDPTANGAMNETCKVPAKHGTPLVVDWSAHQRVELAQAMKNGVAVVSYPSCTELKVLPDCHVGELANAYNFTGVALDDELVIVENQDQLGATFPVHASSFSADIKRGSKLQLDLATVGGTRTIRHHATAKDLVGECQGATHLVVGIDVGAFAMITTTGATVRAGAEMFGAAAKGGSSSDREHHMLVGDRAACATSDPLRAQEPPQQCSVPLRLDIVALDTGVATRVGEAPKTGAVTDDATCAGGLVLVDGLCVPPNRTGVHQCAPGDLADCTKQCTNGDMASCNNLGVIMERGGETNGANEAYDVACRRGYGLACANRGYLLERYSTNGPDDAKVIGLYDQACARGVAYGCGLLGSMFESEARKPGGDPRGFDKATSLYARACAAGDGSGCGSLARSYEYGHGVPQDPRRAFQINLRLCDAAYPAGCSAAGYMLAMGKVGPADRVKGAQLSQRGCEGGDGGGCGDLATILLDPGPQHDPVRARRLVTTACGDLNDFVSCDILAKMMLNGVGGPKDPAQARQLHERACQLGRNVDYCH